MTAYVVFIRERIKDAEEMKLYAQKAGAAREGHAMTPVVRLGEFEVLEGDPMVGCVIVGFPTMREARAWYDSPEYQAAKIHRQNGCDAQVFLVEGFEAAPPAA